MNIDAKITIEHGGTTLTMTLEEAKQLLEKLQRICGVKQQIVLSDPNPVQTWPPPNVWFNDPIPERPCEMPRPVDPWSHCETRGDT